MKNKFVLGLVTALILGTLANITWGYIKYGYFQNSQKASGGGKPVDKDVKDCKNLILFASKFGNLKVTILGNGKPVKNLEVDLSDKPGPNRCMQKTDNNGVVSFTNVPAGRMVIYFNSDAFPKELGKDPTIYIEIVKDKTVEKLLELPYKQ